jgi:hypothetical protein
MVPPTITAERGMCGDCMRGNVDNDRNFCEKMMLDGKCGLVQQFPHHLYPRSILNPYAARSLMPAYDCTG